MMILRPPTVDGSLYNLNPEMLKKQINGCIKHKLGPKMIGREKFIAAVVPHAGYEYSGPVAAWVYARIEKANYIILGPNHHGMGAKFAIMKNGLWKTPLGELGIDGDMADKIRKDSKIVEQDVIAHQYEHSIEVQLPFLQFRFESNFKFVPICILNEFADETLLESCRVVGKAIANIIKKQKDKWIVLASSDFSHYIPQELAEDNDNYVIGSILKLNEKEFFNRINERNATVCGFGPIATTIMIAKELKAKKAELLKYATSGDITSDYSSVVGYASIIFK
jgi:hypothetical protein